MHLNYFSSHNSRVVNIIHKLNQNISNRLYNIVMYLVKSLVVHFVILLVMHLITLFVTLLVTPLAILPPMPPIMLHVVHLDMYSSRHINIKKTPPHFYQICWSNFTSTERSNA